MKGYKGPNRRQEHSKSFKFMLVLNLIGWFLFLLMMLVLHFARPELATGFQKMLGLEAREYWLRDLSYFLLILQSLCITSSAILLWFKYKKARRSADGVWLNIFFLLALSIGSLLWTLSGLAF